MSQTVIQASMFGGGVVAGDVQARVAHILREHPDTRNSYKRLMARYWRDYDGLAEVLGERLEAFEAWFAETATSPKTLQNRAMDVQNADPSLEANQKVEEWRQRMSRIGVVR